MSTRQYDFILGPESATLPATTPTAPDDVVPLSYIQSHFTTQVIGSRSSPSSITAAGGITAGTSYTQVQFVQGNGGSVTITKNPQISAGSAVGQTMTLIGRSNTNTVSMADGTGLSLNGSVTLGADGTITLIWDGSNWVEISRRG